MPRLIDADLFVEDIKTEIVNLKLDGLKGTPRPTGELYDIIDRINEQPTAYDAVVEQILEEIKVLKQKQEKICASQNDEEGQDAEEAYELGYVDGVHTGICDAEKAIQKIINDIACEDAGDDIWNPADEPPEDDRCVLVSFSNYALPLIAYYMRYIHGDGEYCSHTDGRPFLKRNLFVNGWMELPKCKEDD